MNNWSAEISRIRVLVGIATGFLSEAHASRIAAALPGFIGTWSLDRHESCDGDLLLLVSHDRAEAATFIVDATADGFNLSVLRADILTPCGRYDTLEDLIAVMRDLADCVATAMHQRQRANLVV